MSDVLVSLACNLLFSCGDSHIDPRSRWNGWGMIAAGDGFGPRRPRAKGKAGDAAGERDSGVERLRSEPGVVNRPSARRGGATTPAFVRKSLGAVLSGADQDGARRRRLYVRRRWPALSRSLQQRPVGRAFASARCRGDKPSGRPAQHAHTLSQRRRRWLCGASPGDVSARDRSSGPDLHRQRGE
ncbi:hypothetical protein ACVIIZ_000711 [Bradyrhizobium sp. USDA 4523]